MSPSASMAIAVDTVDDELSKNSRADGVFEPMDAPDGGPAAELLQARVVMDRSRPGSVYVEVRDETTGSVVTQMTMRERTTRAGWAYHTAKRALDLALTAPLVAALSPLMLALAAAIWLEDRGPVFFSQDRAGHDGTSFRMLKFRSMTTNAEELKSQLMQRNEAEGGVIFKMRRDPRVTRVGQLMRRYSLDELPQLLNVLRGDMSLVGPRPHPVEEAATYPEDARVRLSVKPGITCLWQVLGRSLIPFSEQMKLDRLYIDNQSVVLDLRILARTGGAVLSGRGAY